MANNPLLNSLGAYAAWDPLRAAAQRRTSFNPAMVSMRRPGGPQAPQRASAPAIQQQQPQQPTQDSWLRGYWLPQQQPAQPSTVTTSQDVANRNFQNYVQQLQQRVQQQLQQPAQQQPAQQQPAQQQPAQQPTQNPLAAQTGVYNRPPPGGWDAYERSIGYPGTNIDAYMRANPGGNPFAAPRSPNYTLLPQIQGYNAPTWGPYLASAGGGAAR